MDIRDIEGNLLWKTTTCIITPAIHVLIARQIASEYMRTVECVDDHQFYNMLTTPIGEIVPSHYVCEREVLNSEADAMVSWIASQDHSWCSDRYYTFDDDYLNTFCVIECTLDELLEDSGKVRIG